MPTARLLMRPTMGEKLEASCRTVNILCSDKTWPDQTLAVSPLMCVLQTLTIATGARSRPPNYPTSWAISRPRALRTKELHINSRRLVARPLATIRLAKTVALSSWKVTTCQSSFHPRLLVVPRTTS